MIQNIAMWAGFASIIFALFAIIVIYLTRKNILDILDKDVILFEKNFELKKAAIENAMYLIDEIEENGERITLVPEFKDRAKACYNQLLCVSSDVRTADEFYSIALDTDDVVTEQRLAQFKLACRRDLGLNTKKAKAVKRLAKGANKLDTNNTAMPRGNVQPTMPSTYITPRPSMPQTAEPRTNYAAAPVRQSMAQQLRQTAAQKRASQDGNDQ